MCMCLRYIRERTTNKYHLITCDMICKAGNMYDKVCYFFFFSSLQMIWTIGMPKFVFHNSGTFYFVVVCIFIVFYFENPTSFVFFLSFILQLKFHKNPFSLKKNKKQNTKPENKQIKYYYLFSIYWHKKSFLFAVAAIGPKMSIKCS